jgi:hypothetical protein
MQSAWYRRMLFQSGVGLVLFSGFIGLLVGFGIPYSDGRGIGASAVSAIITMLLTMLVAWLVHLLVIKKRL